MIRVEGLKKTFTKKIRKKGFLGFLKGEKKNFEAVRNINFEIKDGEIVGFVGPNGAGKSTTIKMLTGIIHPTEGNVEVLGLNPTKDRKVLGYKIGCMFGQKSSLWMHLPAIDTYRLLGAVYDIPKQELEERINELVELFNLQEIINVPVRKLSLGQRMICEIAAVMLHKPAILDTNKKYNTTIFLTSHDLGDIEKVCERIIIIDKGTIIKDESIETLKHEYLSEKFITIMYDNNIENVEFDYPIMSKAENKIMLKVDTKRITISEILEKFMKYGNIIDMEALPLPLEEVIYDIYTK